MSLDCLNEAFKRLDALTEETFNTSSTGLNDLSSFLDKDNTDDLVKIIDPEAETEDELKDSYIGKVIINCNICHSNIFKDKEAIEIDTDGIVNVEDQCPYCGEESGFAIIGEITPFNASTNDSEEDIEDIEVNVSEEDEDSLDEGLFKSKSEDKYTKIIPEIQQALPEFCKNNEIDNCPTIKSVKEGRDNNLIFITNFGKALINRDIVDDFFKPSEEDKEYAMDCILAEVTSFDKCYNESLKLKEGSSKTKWKPHTRKLMSLLGIDDAEGEISEGIFGHKESSDEIKYRDALQKQLEKSGAEQNIKQCPKIKSVQIDKKSGHVIIKTDLTPKVDFYTDMDSWDQDDIIDHAETVLSNIPEKYLNETSNTDLTESVNNVNVETDDSIVNVHTEEDGKVVVSTEPKTEQDTFSDTTIEDETITPLSDETQAEIESENGLDTLEDTLDVESTETNEEDDSLEADVDIEEVDEEGLDELGEAYLKKVYENIESFKTTKVGTSETKLVVEGLITFKSGKQKKTGFIFEAQSINQKGVLKFVGENKHLHEHKRAFTLTAQYKDKKLLPESLGYRYTSSDKKPKFGKVRRKR